MIDLFNPFVIFIAFGFILGAISTYLLIKISNLEKENEILSRKLNLNNEPVIEKINKKNELINDISKKNDKTEDNEEKKKEKENEEEKKEDEVKEDKKNDNKKEEKKKEIKDNKNVEEKKENTFPIKNPNFKRPEIKEKNYEEEGEWKVITKRSKKKPH